MVGFLSNAVGQFPFYLRREAKASSGGKRDGSRFLVGGELLPGQHGSRNPRAVSERASERSEALQEFF